MLLRYSPESTNCRRYCSRVTPRVSLKTNQELAQGVRPERPVRPLTAMITSGPGFARLDGGEAAGEAPADDEHVGLQGDERRSGRMCA